MTKNKYGTLVNLSSLREPYLIPFLIDVIMPDGRDDEVHHIDNAARKAFSLCALRSLADGVPSVETRKASRVISGDHVRTFVSINYLRRIGARTYLTSAAVRTMYLMLKEMAEEKSIEHFFLPLDRMGEKLMAKKYAHLFGTMYYRPLDAADAFDFFAPQGILAKPQKRFT